MKALHYLYSSFEPMYAVASLLVTQVLNTNICDTMLILLALVILTPCYVFYKLFLQGVVPGGITWAGTNGTGRIAQLKSTLLATFRLRMLLKQEYAKVRGLTSQVQSCN